MARKPKEAEINTPDETKGKAYGGIGVADLERLMARQDEIAADASKLNGDSSANLNRVEKLGGHKAVFKLVRQIKDMDQNNGQAFVRAFFSYMMVLGIFEDLELTTEELNETLEQIILGPLFQTTSGNPEMATETAVH